MTKGGETRYKLWAADKARPVLLFGLFGATGSEKTKERPRSLFEADFGVYGLKRPQGLFVGSRKKQNSLVRDSEANHS